MTLNIFRLLAPVAQLHYVLSRGTYLAQRWKAEDGSVPIYLYYLPDGGRGFFAEVGVKKAQHRFVVLHNFSSSGPLADYAQRVRLPEL